MNIEKKRIETEIVSEVKAEKEYSLLGSRRLHIDGGSVFEYDLETELITKVEFVFDDVIEIGVKPKRRINTNPNCLYVEALNLRNAKKHLRKGNIFLSTKK